MYYDKNNIPIYPGDLLRTYHFKDRFKSGKINYLYHTVVEKESNGRKFLEMVPTSHLEPTHINQGGKCWLNEYIAQSAEVISGDGPGNIAYYERKKIK